MRAFQFCFEQLLLEHAEEIAPDTSDPLHDILEELGEVPDLATLVGQWTLQVLAEIRLPDCSFIG